MKITELNSKKYHLLENADEITAQRYNAFHYYYAQCNLGDTVDSVHSHLRDYLSGYNEFKAAECVVYLSNTVLVLDNIIRQKNAFQMAYAVILLSEEEFSNKGNEAAYLSESYLESKLQDVFANNLTQKEVVASVVNFQLASLGS